MLQLKFDKNGLLKLQRINYVVKHDEEFVEKYIKNECNFRVDYDNEANPIFIKKKKKNKEEKENELL